MAESSFDLIENLAIRTRLPSTKWRHNTDCESSAVCPSDNSHIEQGASGSIRGWKDHHEHRSSLPHPFLYIHLYPLYTNQSIISFLPSPARVDNNQYHHEAHHPLLLAILALAIAGPAAHPGPEPMAETEAEAAAVDANTLTPRNKEIEAR